MAPPPHDGDATDPPQIPPRPGISPPGLPDHEDLYTPATPRRTSRPPVSDQPILAEEDDGQGNLSEDGLVVPVAKVARPKSVTRAKPLGSDEVQRFDADPDGDTPKPQPGPIEERVRAAAEAKAAEIRRRDQAPPLPPAPNVPDPGDTGAFTKEGLAAILQEDDDDPWFRSERSPPQEPGQPSRSNPMSDITPQGFGPEDAVVKTAESTRNNWIRPVAAIAAIAAVAAAMCAGVTIGLPTVGWLGGAFGDGTSPEKVAEGTVPTPLPDLPTEAVVTTTDTEEPTWLLCSPTSITYEEGRMRYFKDLSTKSVLGREDFRIRGLSPQQTCVREDWDDIEIAREAKLNAEGLCEVDGLVDTTLSVMPLCADSKGALVSAEMLREHLATSYQPVNGLDGVTAKCCPGSIHQGCTAPTAPAKPEPVASNR